MSHHKVFVHWELTSEEGVLTQHLPSPRTASASDVTDYMSFKRPLVTINFYLLLFASNSRKKNQSNINYDVMSSIESTSMS